MAERRGLSRLARATALVAVLGGAGLVLAACTFSSPHPATIPTGTSAGKAVGTLNFSITTSTSNGVATTRLTFRVVTGTGSVELTPVADADVQPGTSGRYHATGPCTPTPVTPSTLVCPPLVATRPGLKTLTFVGIKVNSSHAFGKVEATLVVNGIGFDAIAATYVAPPAVSAGPTTKRTPPSFHSAASTTFVAGVHGMFPVRVHGSPSTLSLVGAPSWLSLTPHSDYLEGTPPGSAVGHHVFTIVASTDPRTTRPHGDNLTAKQTFTLTVTS